MDASVWFNVPNHVCLSGSRAYLGEGPLQRGPNTVRLWVGRHARIVYRSIVILYLVPVLNLIPDMAVSRKNPG
jgi:hypothetical protein